MENKKIVYCLVCGFDLRIDPNYKLNDLFFMCPCCGFHYGVEDVGERNCYMSARKEWIENGMRFSSIILSNKYKWEFNNLKKQLEQLKFVRLLNSELNPDYTTEVDINIIKKFWDKFR